MVKWQYLKLVTLEWPANRVKRDKEGLYVENARDMRLDPQDGWEEDEKLGKIALIRDPESDYWRRDIDILDRLGQQGWEAVSLALVQPMSSGIFAMYLLKRPTH